MPIIPGRVVALGLEDTAREGVNLHDISGSHDLERVRQAVKMKIRSVTRLEADKTQVRIDVTNVGSGHRFPTGLPLRWAILEVNLSDRGSIVARREIEFKKVLLNERGVPVTREHEVFLAARSIGMDTRLKPKERRTVRLTFDNVRAPEGVVEATLWYYYSTRAVKTENGVETVEPVEMKFLLASEKRRLRGTGG